MSVEGIGTKHHKVMEDYYECSEDKLISLTCQLLPVICEEFRLHYTLK